MEEKSRKNKEEIIRLINQLQKEVTCPICLDLFSNPVSLSECHHTFCKNCFTDLIKTSTKPNCVDCPLCKKAVNRRNFEEDTKIPEIIKLVQKYQIILLKQPIGKFETPKRGKSMAKTPKSSAKKKKSVSVKKVNDTEYPTLSIEKTTNLKKAKSLGCLRENVSKQPKSKRYSLGNVKIDSEQLSELFSSQNIRDLCKNDRQVIELMEEDCLANLEQAFCQNTKTEPGPSKSRNSETTSNDKGWSRMKSTRKSLDKNEKKLKQLEISTFSTKSPKSVTVTKVAVTTKSVDKKKVRNSPRLGSESKKSRCNSPILEPNTKKSKCDSPTPILGKRMSPRSNSTKKSKNLTDSDSESKKFKNSTDLDSELKKSKCDSMASKEITTRSKNSPKLDSETKKSKKCNSPIRSPDKVEKRPKCASPSSKSVIKTNLKSDRNFSTCSSDSANLSPLLLPKSFKLDQFENYLQENLVPIVQLEPLENLAEYSPKKEVRSTRQSSRIKNSPISETKTNTTNDIPTKREIQRGKIENLVRPGSPERTLKKSDSERKTSENSVSKSGQIIESNGEPQNVQNTLEGPKNASFGPKSSHLEGESSKALLSVKSSKNAAEKKDPTSKNDLEAPQSDDLSLGGSSSQKENEPQNEQNLSSAAQNVQKVTKRLGIRRTAKKIGKTFSQIVRDMQEEFGMVQKNSKNAKKDENKVEIENLDKIETFEEQNSSKIDILVLKGQNQGPKGQNEGPKVQNDGPKVQNQGSKGQNEDLKGQNLGPKNQNNFKKDQNQGPKGQNLGSKNQNELKVQNHIPKDKNLDCKGQNELKVQNQDSKGQNWGPKGQNEGPKVQNFGLKGPNHVPNDQNLGPEVQNLGLKGQNHVPNDQNLGPKNKNQGSNDQNHVPKGQNAQNQGPNGRNQVTLEQESSLAQNIPPDDDIFEVPTQILNADENEARNCVETANPNREEIFDICTQKLSEPIEFDTEEQNTGRRFRLPFCDSQKSSEGGLSQNNQIVVQAEVHCADKNSQQIFLSQNSKNGFDDRMDIEETNFTENIIVPNETKIDKPKIAITKCLETLNLIQNDIISKNDMVKEFSQFLCTSKSLFSPIQSQEERNPQEQKIAQKSNRALTEELVKSCPTISNDKEVIEFYNTAIPHLNKLRELYQNYETIFVDMTKKTKELTEIFGQNSEPLNALLNCERPQISQKGNATECPKLGPEMPQKGSEKPQIGSHGLQLGSKMPQGFERSQIGFNEPQIDFNGPPNNHKIKNITPKRDVSLQTDFKLLCSKCQNQIFENPQIKQHENPFKGDENRLQRGENSLNGDGNPFLKKTEQKIEKKINRQLDFKPKETEKKFKRIRNQSDSDSESDYKKKVVKRDKNPFSNNDLNIIFLSEQEEPNIVQQNKNLEQVEEQSKGLGLNPQKIEKPQRQDFGSKQQNWGPQGQDFGLKQQNGGLQGQDFGLKQQNGGLQGQDFGLKQQNRGPRDTQDFTEKYKNILEREYKGLKSKTPERNNENALANCTGVEINLPSEATITEKQKESSQFSKSLFTETENFNKTILYNSYKPLEVHKITSQLENEFNNSFGAQKNTTFEKSQLFSENTTQKGLETQFTKSLFTETNFIAEQNNGAKNGDSPLFNETNFIPERNNGDSPNEKFVNTPLSMFTEKPNFHSTELDKTVIDPNYVAPISPKDIFDENELDKEVASHLSTSFVEDSLDGCSENENVFDDKIDVIEGTPEKTPGKIRRQNTSRENLEEFLIELNRNGECENQALDLQNTEWLHDIAPPPGFGDSEKPTINSFEAINDNFKTPSPEMFTNVNENDNRDILNERVNLSDIGSLSDPNSQKSNLETSKTVKNQSLDPIKMMKTLGNKSLDVGYDREANIKNFSGNGEKFSGNGNFFSGNGENFSGNIRHNLSGNPENFSGNSKNVRNLGEGSKNCNEDEILRVKDVDPLSLVQNEQNLALTLVKSKNYVPKTISSTPKQTSIFNFIKPTTVLSPRTPKSSSNPKISLEPGSKDCLSPKNLNEPIDMDITPIKLKSKKEICLACTRLKAEDSQKLLSMTEKFKLSFSKNFTSKVTHLIVTVDDRNRIKDLTMKYVSAIANGIWIVSFLWVLECLKFDRILPEEQYEVLDISGLPGPQKSRLTRKTKPLFKDFVFYCSEPFESVTKTDLENVLTNLGAEVVTNLAALKKKGKISLVLTEFRSSQDFEIYQNWFDSMNIISVEIEWLSRSVGQYEVTSVRPFMLCEDHGQPNNDYPPYLLAVVPESLTECTDAFTERP